MTQFCYINKRIYGLTNGNTELGDTLIGNMFVSISNKHIK